LIAIKWPHAVRIKLAPVDEEKAMQYLEVEDSRTMMKIGINVAVLVAVALALIVVSAALT
jgi:hypothetical protein